MLGLVLVAVGALLAAVPLTAARFTAWARFAPYSTDPVMVRYHRAAGAALVVIGAAAAVALA
jgi:hypothetical protein